MGDFEQLLRRAMVDETAAVAPPPDFVERVRHRYRRRQRRVRVSAAFASIALVVVAVPLGWAVAEQESFVPPTGPAVHGIGGPTLSPTPSPAEQDIVGCPVPELRPGVLPWLEPGQQVPEPHLVEPGTDEHPDSSLRWLMVPDAEDVYQHPYVSLVREWSSETEPGERWETRMQVRQHAAEVYWVGDPGVSSVVVRWREAPGECGVYRLHLGSAGLGPLLGEQFTEEGQCWGRISAGDVCSRQYHEQIDAQMTRLVVSLTGEAAQLQE